jgi:hypothetical protein
MFLRRNSLFVIWKSRSLRSVWDIGDVRNYSAAGPTIALKIGLLLWYGLLFVIGFVAEFVISIFLVQIAGIGFEGRLLLSFCFTCSIVTGPFWVLKFIESICDEAGKKRFRHWLSWVAGASAVLSVIVFTATMGMAAHHEMNELGAEGMSSSPVLWPMFLCSSAMLATSLAMGGYFLRLQIDTFYTLRQERNVQHTAATTDSNRLADELYRAESLIFHGHRIHFQLDSKLKTHINAALRLLGKREAVREAKRKQILAGF